MDRVLAPFTHRVSDSGLRLYPQSRRRVLPMGPAFEDETYWAGSSTSTSLRHDFLYPTPKATNT